MRRGEVYLPILLGIGFAICLVELSRYRWEVALSSALASGLGLILSLTLLLRSHHNTTNKNEAQVFGRSDFVQFAWLTFAAASVITFGFGFGGGSYVFLHVLMTRPGKYKLLVALICGAVVPVVVFGVFQEMLEIRLFAGLVFR